MHMPAGSHQSPILSCGSRAQLEGLRRALAPQRWPLDPALLPAEALLVGGAVRDALLGRLGERPDLDLVVEGDAIALARGLARRCGGSCVVLDAERSIARLVLKGWSFDLARRMGGSLEQDLARRDYSINAIALPLAVLCGEEGSDGSGVQAEEPPMAAAGPGPAAPTAPEGAPDGAAGPATSTAWISGSDLGPIDPGGGLADLRARRLRALGEANLLEDPLRLLRGVRLACELGFTIDTETLTWIDTHHLRRAEVAGERVLAELERLAAAPDGAAGLLRVLQLGLLRGWQAEPQDEAEDGAMHAQTARWLERLTPDRTRRSGLQPGEQDWALPLARLAALLPPPALVRLRASRRLQQRCQRLRHWLQHLENGRPPADATGTEAEVLREDMTLADLPEEERLALQRELEEDLPALALHLAPQEARQALQRWRDGDDPLFHPRPPLDGQQLQRLLGIPPGRTLGALLAHLTRERAFGRLAAEGGPDPVLQVARHWLAGCGNGGADPSSGGQAP